MLVRDGVAIRRADLSRSTSEIERHSLELKVFAARAETAEGFVCLPQDDELHTLRLARDGTGSRWKGSPCKEGWRGGCFPPLSLSATSPDLGWTAGSPQASLIERVMLRARCTGHDRKDEGELAAL